MIFKIKLEAEKEAYLYFDKHIRPIPKNESGELIINGSTARNNDVDAFRHAYVSGVFTLKWGEVAANILGQANEIKGDMSDPSQPEKEKNMDLWNNKVGREYAKKVNSKKELANLLALALERGELIITANQEEDNRKYEPEDYDQKIDKEKSVIVIEESETGRNELFLDLLTGNLMHRKLFVSLIESGKYSGYAIASIDGIATPMSKADKVTSNNLG